jgi:hypothetical protein
MPENHPSLQSSSTTSKPAQASSWQRCMNKAMREPNADKLLLLVQAPEDALMLRWRKLDGDATHNEERAAMDAACHNLWEIKNHRLGWPWP